MWRNLLSDEGRNIAKKAERAHESGDLELARELYLKSIAKFRQASAISIGDYVLSGGELAGMVVIDAVARQLPGVVGDADSVKQDSFSSFTGLLDYPHYTRPEVIDGHVVPKVLLGGNHAEITCWRRKEALGRTWLRRPDLLEKIELTAADRMLLNEFIENIK